MEFLRALDVVGVMAADGSIHVACEQKRQCGVCGRFHHFFVNRDGRTRCFFCDDSYLRGPAPETCDLKPETSAVQL